MECGKLTPYVSELKNINQENRVCMCHLLWLRKDLLSQGQKRVICSSYIFFLYQGRDWNMLIVVKAKTQQERQRKEVAEEAVRFEALALSRGRALCPFRLEKKMGVLLNTNRIQG